MFKNQLQELAQRSCFNLPSYACVREGPDHAPRFKASVNFNGEVFEGPTYSTTLRQAEHAAAEVALNSLSARGPSKSLTARVLDETGVYKNLLQESAHRAGLKLPVYTTVRSGPGHVPVFTSTVELAGITFSGDAAKTKKQAEKNAAIAAWSALKQGPILEQQQEMVKGGSGRWSNSLNGRVIRHRDHHQPRPTTRLIHRPAPAPVPPVPNQRVNINFNPSPSTTKLAHKRPPCSEREREREREREEKRFLSVAPAAVRSASKILPPKLIGSPSETRAPLPWDGDDGEHKHNNYNQNEGISPAANITNLSRSSSWSSRSLVTVGGVFCGELGASNSEVAMKRTSHSHSHSHSHREMGLVSKLGGGYGFGFAPAVQIRSVIPVCASPPVTVRPITPTPTPTPNQSSLATSDLASSLGNLNL